MDVLQERLDQLEPKKIKQIHGTSEYEAISAQGVAHCIACTSFYSLVTHNSTQKNSPWAAQNGGVHINDSNYTQSRYKHFFAHNHATGSRGSAMHGEAANLRKVRMRSVMPVAVTKLAVDRKAAMKRLFRTLIFVVQRHHPFCEYEHLCNLMQENGCALGSREHSRKTSSAMLQVVAEMLRDQARAYLTRPCPFTGRKRHIDVAADKMRDE